MKNLFMLAVLAGAFSGNVMAQSAVLPDFGNVKFGQGSSGGGDPIEAGFKTKLIEIVKNAQAMSDEARSHLKFDLDQLEATVTVGNFEPLCASKGKLSKLLSMGKIAYVFDETPTEVTLNCQKENRPTWSAMFNSAEDKDIIFFIHEGLRVMGVEGENNYQYSSSYLAASRVAVNERRESPRIWDRKVKQAMSDLIYPSQQAVCRILVKEVDLETSANKFLIYLYKGDNVIRRIGPIISAGRDNVISGLINRISNWDMGTTNSIYESYKQHCE